MVGVLFALAMAGAQPTINMDPLMIDLHNNVEDTLKAVAVPGVEIEDVAYMECGEVNAAYIPLFKSIIICDELAHEMPGFQRVAVAHEYGHAVIHQLDLPYTGSEEVAADEFAEFSLTALGRFSDVEDAAVFYSQNGMAEDPTDAHPSDARRAYTFECAVNGFSEDPTDECRSYVLHLYRTWIRLLKPAFQATDDREIRQ